VTIPSEKRWTARVVILNGIREAGNPGILRCARNDRWVTRRVSLTIATRPPGPKLQQSQPELRESQLELRESQTERRRMRSQSQRLSGFGRESGGRTLRI
jgi:hypothetical protein